MHTYTHAVGLTWSPMKLQSSEEILLSSTYSTGERGIHHLMGRNGVQWNNISHAIRKRRLINMDLMALAVSLNFSHLVIY